jgi:hypothetical protein
MLMPTWRTWFVLVTTAGLMAVLLVPRLHGWLAVVEPEEKAPYLIVEGWAPDYVLEEAAAYIKGAPVKRLFATGVPIDTGTYLTGYLNYSHLCAESLAKIGVDRQTICEAPAEAVKTERTRAMAAALKAILDAENIPEADRRINLFTLGTHGRRSRRIFQETLGSTWKVGVVSVPSRDYDAAKWYRQSAGAKTVIDELVALTVQSSGGN